MGPCHACDLGWAKSFIRNLDSETMVNRYLITIDALFITWILVQSVMPSEIQDYVDLYLEEADLISLAIHNVEAGF